MKKFTLFILIILCGYFNNASAQQWTSALCSGGPPSATIGTTYGPMNSIATANASNRHAFILSNATLSDMIDKPLTSMWFHKATAAAMLGTPNFKIYLKETTAIDWGASALDWATAITGATLAFDGNPVSNIGATIGWKEFLFTSNFTVTGTNNLAVMVEYTNPTASVAISWSYEYTSSCVNTSNLNTTKYLSNTTGILPASLTSSNYRRPYVGFNYVASCYPPTGLTLSASTTTTTAPLTWTAPVSPPANGYEIYYSSSSIAPTAGTTPNATTGAGITSTTLNGLSPSTIYYTWIRSACGPSEKSLWVAGIIFATLPANDECITATTFPTIPTDGSCAIMQVSTYGATSSLAGCSGTADDDVWYSVTMPAGSTILLYNNQNNQFGLTDRIIQLFSGTCGSLTSVACLDPESGSVAGLTGGTTYYLRVYTYAATGGTVFDLCLKVPPPPPANDDCIAATNIIPSGTELCASSIVMSTSGATQSTETVPTCSATGINDDVWFTFTATSATHMVKVNYTDNATTTQLYSGSCGSLVAIGCYAGLYGNSNVLATGLTIGNVYYVRIYSSTSTAYTYSNFSICVTTPSVPVNDDCTNATAIPCGSNVSGSNALALNEVLPGSTCGSTGLTASYKGVWHTVTPNLTGSLTVSACGSDFDNYLRIYTGDCNTLTCVSNVSGVGYADAGCAVTLNNSATVTFPCVAGTTYYILLTGYSATNFGNYNISVTCPLACTVPPTALAVSGITSNGGVISYTAPIPAPLVGYQYYYSTSSTPPTVATVPTGSTPNASFTLNSLNPNTLYYVWVRSNCGGSDVSAWAALPSFMTLPGSGCFTTITATPSANICIGGSASLSASGSWVSYSWSGPGGFNSTNPTVVANLTGVYALTVTDVDACTTFANITVTVNPLPVVTITPAAPTICPGSTVTLTASGGATYLWSNGANTAAAVVNSVGTYTVTVTSAAGCIKTGSVTVTANPPITVTAVANPNSICIGSTINLAATGGATYSWNGPAGFTSTLQNPTRANATVAMSGVYNVTVTSAAGCIGYASATVTVNAGPIVSASANPNPACVGSTLNLSSSGGVMYAWSGPAGFSSNAQNPARANMQPSFAGIYSVSVTSGLGCTSNSSVNVTVNPIPTGVATASPSSGCVGSTVQLGAPAGSTYMWTGPQGYTSSQQNPIVNITSYLQAGTYKVKVTNAAGCSATFSVGFKVNYPPVATASYTIGSNCIGSNLALSGTGGGSFSWSGPAGFTSNLQNPVINNVSAANSGVYTLTVTSPNGCSAVTSLSVTILAAPVVTATADAYTVCEGSTAYLHATGGTNYEWTGPYGWVSNLQNPIINNIPSYLSGTYSVKVTNSGGCSTTTSLVITVSGFINGSASALPNPAPTGSNVQLSATGASSYLWSGPNGFFSYEQNPVLYKVSSRNAGTYVVILTNDGKCQMTLFVTLSIINARESGETIVAKETKVSDLTTIYPNPAKNFIRLEYKGDKSIKYSIVDAQGVIITKDVRSSSGSINIENLSSGTYAIIWSEDTENAQTNIGKFIKVD
ncbi:MAG: fibronectin type III domain-containing protein [Saprospiraceae bacterium]|uniref:fibronectin type III domain-containing protein n=1 Tax=Candidatus Brachybacter algidus TaxID=2982024 RepID=UPI00257C0ADC|nr:fibronectin type III domain-containing protein [Candidatus Brachybacter algidus]MBK7602537.1 fibronectin type III domain-containing protein [Candidatus Brachybacter algidus]